MAVLWNHYWEEEFTDVIELTEELPEDPYIAGRGRILRAASLVALGDARQALEVLEEAPAVASEDAVLLILVERMIAYLALGRVKDALRMIRMMNRVWEEPSEELLDEMEELVLGQHGTGGSRWWRMKMTVTNTWKFIRLRGQWG